MGRLNVYRTANGSVYVQLPTGVYTVIRLDGGAETRHHLPDSAVPLAPTAAADTPGGALPLTGVAR